MLMSVMPVYGEEMQYKLTLFLMYYNHRRRRSGLGMNGMTSVEKLSVRKAKFDCCHNTTIDKDSMMC